jgi:Sec-independent protein translocase protein TatA
MARSLGSGITEFKRGLKDGNNKPSDGGTGNQPQPPRNDTPNDGTPR